MKNFVFASVVLLSVFCLLIGAGFAQQQITLKFWKFAAPVDDPIIEKYINLWNELHPDVKVEFVTLPWSDYVGLALPAAFASGDAPDVFWLSPGDLLRYVNEGMLAPLNEHVTETDLADLVPAARQRPTIEGVLYGLPVEMEPVAIYYNVDLFEEAGLRPPRTFDELLNTGEKLKTEDRYALIIEPVPSYYQLFVWYPFLWGAGADVVSPDWKKATMNTEGAIAALKIWGDLIKKGLSPSTLTAGGSGNIVHLLNKFAAMQLVGMWAISDLKLNPPDFKIDIFPVPTLNENLSPVSVFGGWNFVVNSKSPHQKEAIEFSRWFVFESDFLKEFCVDRESKLPSRVSLVEASKEKFAGNPLARKFIETILPIARPEPRYPTDIAKALMDALSFVMFADLPAEEAARLANFQIQNFLDNYKGRIGAYTD
ncbi:ABC transporter substrate-binding protein [Candidatus Caldatribacterium saccharofermentans]|uniref:ABC transporter substrate-binding protein n=1 Tax=Candidatus Caldatribacterium saccharofermentans TaxID=1454753 RepID=UPI003D04BA7D